jgi:hypothetical protein
VQQELVLLQAQEQEVAQQLAAAAAAADGGDVAAADAAAAADESLARELFDIREQGALLKRRRAELKRLVPFDFDKQ